MSLKLNTSSKNSLTVGIDASRTTLTQVTGTENYSINITRQLLEYQSNIHWRLYFRNQPHHNLFPKKLNVCGSVLPFPFMWTHLRFAMELLTNPPDGVFIPAHVLPYHCKIPSIVTIHDLGFIRYPNLHPLSQRKYLLWSTKHNVTHSSHLIADSQSTKQDIIKYYNINKNKVSVVYPGFDAAKFQHTSKSVGFKLPDRYILYVGTIHPRKGLQTLIDSFAKITKSDSSIHMVLVGQKGWMVSKLKKQVEDYGLNNKIHFTGFVPQKYLPAVYNKALVTVLPSLYEGFGYTPLESMASKTPVVCTDAGSLPEVVGDAALVVSSNNSEDLTSALVTAINNLSVRKTLVEKGLNRCGLFTWKDAASKTIDIMTKTFVSR